ncbi:MAG: hypothetical protein DMG13_28695 [Acidobacteria bacterium]|nr:MAG: hypothetical protein DMG13_28695 [Acidobacteriota bacterium]
MRHCIVRSIIVAASLLVFASISFAQAPSQSGAKKVTDWGGQAEGPAPSKLPPINPNEKFDPHDFSGLWRPTGGRMMTDWDKVPPRTPGGEQVFQSRITGRAGPQKKAVEPAKGNDPIMTCNPKGIPRLLFYTGGQAAFYHVPGQVLMEFQSQGATRHIWMDGRELPKNPDGRWMGYSIGHWEGDTLVVDTVGFDDRAWLDQWGNVYSSDMHFQERWRRTDRDTLEAVYRIDDPKTYTRPWISDTKIWKRQAGEIREELCAPMDENFFNENVRDPAAGIIHK